MTYDPQQVWRAEVPKCQLHPGVKWNGDEPCFVCYPTQDRLGTVEHRASILPNEGERTATAVNRCIVIRSKDDEVQCGKPGTRTVLGFRICDECFEAVAL